MTSPRQHLFGLGLFWEADGDAAHQNDDSLGLFDDIYDVGIGCGGTTLDCQGTESVSLNQNIDINSQVQPLIVYDTPRLSVRKSPDIQQQSLTGNEPINNYNSWGTQQQPIIIKETPELPSNDSWQHADGSQVLLGDIFTDIWDLPSPSDPFWSHFPRRPFQAETNDGDANDYNPGLTNQTQIIQAQTQTSDVNQSFAHTTRPQAGNLGLINQHISSDTINELPASHPIRQYLAQTSQQPQESIQPVAVKQHGAAPNDAQILEEPAAKRLKTNSGNAAPRPKRVKAKDGNASSRTARRIELDPTQYYQPLAQTPQSWGTVNSDGRHRFRYNGFGELKPGMTFAGEEMVEYLYGSFPRIDNLETNNPSLFIQCVPSDSNSRYPTALSNKCRFRDCPVKMRTIPSGHFRVAFDEQNDEKLDPYHCAGYVHLYCLERFCSFSSLAKYCNIVPDTRELREGRNRMSITRDHSGFARLCMVYMEDSRHKDPHANGWEYRNTLCSLLAEEYLRLEARVRRETRERQGGNNIGVHRNDMELYAWGQEKKMILRSMAAQNKSNKRKRRSDEEDEEINNYYEYGG
ncbi:hypothetical protein V492_06353 [Pseudogymnoascus sp. VKM F-4246]|nr:hypothetical protein V492_06353 [Pseudogymnoascus sp. VKM F-4246]